MLELAGIIILGILAQWVAWRFKLPSRLPLIIIGLLAGPISTLFTADGAKLLEPVWNGTEGLFPGERLFNFVSLAIGIILFEGGLTLKKRRNFKCWTCNFKTNYIRIYHNIFWRRCCSSLYF